MCIIMGNVHFVSRQALPQTGEMQDADFAECSLDNSFYMVPSPDTPTTDEIQISFRHCSGHSMFKKRWATDTSGRCDFSTFTLVVLFAPNVRTGGGNFGSGGQDLSFA